MPLMVTRPGGSFVPSHGQVRHLDVPHYILSGGIFTKYNKGRLNDHLAMGVRTGPEQQDVAVRLL